MEECECENPNPKIYLVYFNSIQLNIICQKHENIHLFYLILYEMNMCNCLDNLSSAICFSDSLEFHNRFGRCFFRVMYIEGSNL